MAMLLGALGDVLLKADRAAEEIAMYDRELAGIPSDLKLLKWITGASFADVVTILFQVFMH